MDSDENQNSGTALVDLDGSCANYDQAMVRELNKIRSPNEPEIKNIPYGHVPAYLQHRMDLIKRQPGFWLGLPTIQIGLDICELLRDRLKFQLMVLSKGPKRTTAAWTEKVEWVAKHLPHADVTITHDKGLVYGRILFDDYPPYILRWLAHRPRGKVLMLDTPYNQEFVHPNVLRIQQYETLQEEQIIEISTFLTRQK